ncbi:hypothetical protein HETIRDRAFT_329423 [Heterobasidion irregulare TC 32-1]|uniref:VWFA domain-containing protein n=1 Tax=Heterobasidion irregulare (strain TC 32-1) TaxID=747525 RepID=W4JRQ2_HETIT|nr:uncharacterized protein HETIRDRAFT_329423 [Heterobasidion irregulare TC 32-1]ETW76252.1 hypothetical protein HETIRDRAFT_329423 [Heterobasidion irregulare TC 32-1]
MTCSDRRPLLDTPSSTLIRQRADNRYGAALSSLYSFLAARRSLIRSATGARNDAYSVVTFSSSARTRVTNDFSSTPDQLLSLLLTQEEAGGTNFDAALKEAQQTMQSSFSSERAPVLIFLSDGECSVRDETVYDICRKAVTLGKPLSFHAVSFGQDYSSSQLRRMAQLAEEVYSTAPQDQLASTATISCSYTNAIDTIQLTETFLGIADSLTKTRASLIRG